jgi:hypothetical protein
VFTARYVPGLQIKQFTFRPYRVKACCKLVLGVQAKKGETQREVKQGLVQYSPSTTYTKFTNHLYRTCLNSTTSQRTKFFYSSASQAVRAPVSQKSYYSELINGQGRLFTALGHRHSSAGLVDKVQPEPGRTNYTVTHNWT